MSVVDLPQRADAQQALDDKAAEEFKAPSWQAAAKVWRDNLRRMHGGTETRSCYCIGRQNGQPVCPCRMERVRIVDGRYIEVIDHGPAPKRFAGEEGR